VAVESVDVQVEKRSANESLVFKARLPRLDYTESEAHPYQRGGGAIEYSQEEEEEKEEKKGEEEKEEVGDGGDAGQY